MKLVQVAKTIVTTGDSTIAINGIDSDDVYLLVGTDIISTQSNCELHVRVNASSSAQTTSNYDYGSRTPSSTNMNTRNAQNQDKGYIVSNVHTYGMNFSAFLYNFNNASEYSYIEHESVADVSNQKLGEFGGTVFTVAAAHNGVTLHGHAGTFNSGNLYLYKVI
tara:strand:+ start:850 stop:1341 length:492 start_codon:yes stop_codon:yes gene_type:complete